MTDDLTFAFAFDDQRPPGRTPIYRVRRSFRSGRVDRFYTASLAERDDAVARHGYEPEGVACEGFDRPAPGTVPLIRLWHRPSRQHAFTVVPDNLRGALARGTCRNEGVAAYVFGTAREPGTVPLHALVHRPTNAHLYTADPEERDAALATGYEALGVACWVYPAETEGADG